MRIRTLALGGLLVFATAVAGAELEHPVIKPIEGFQLDEGDSTSKGYAEQRFIREDEDGHTHDFVKKGKYWYLQYEKRGDDGSIDRSFSALQIIENHIEALREIEGTILRRYGDELYFELPRPDGGISYVWLRAWDGEYRLHIIDEKPLKRQLDFTSADDMLEGLETAGFVAVYGIHFDVDRADLQVGASKTLDEVVRLLKSKPDLKVEIQGHTDSTGTDEHNLELSQRRAETVKQYLILHGIANQRMTCTGLGESKPVADNSTEEGRALNRRVELHRAN